MSGEIVRGYTAFLRRFLNGFVEENPLRRSKRRPRRRRENVVRHKPPKRSPGPKSRVRKRFEPLQAVFTQGETWQKFGSTYLKVSGVPVQLPGQYKGLKWTKDFTNPGPPYRTGGEFTSINVSLYPHSVLASGTYDTWVNINVGSGSRPTQYRGGFWGPSFAGIDETDANLLSPTFITAPTSGIVPSLTPYHTLVDKIRPQINRANLGQGLAEISQVPRMLSGSAKDFRDYWRFVGGSPSSRRMSPKGASDSFLGAQFGWAPFIRDIGDVFDVVKNFDAYSQAASDKNGRWDHRERVLFENTTDQIISTGEGMKCSPNLWWLNALTADGQWISRYSYTKREVLRVWASGDYKYYRPEFDMSRRDYDSGLNQIKRVSALLGTDISPSLLWNITPWTWLADWYGNVGSVISAITAASLDGVVSKNVFLMVSSSRNFVLQQQINMWKRPIAFEFHRQVACKQRGHASTPYNFGLLPGNLSARQYAILAALGISKFS